MNRRKYLTAFGATTASLGLSGCMGILGGDDETDDTTTNTQTTEGALEDETTTDTATDTTTADNETEQTTEDTTTDQTTEEQTTTAESNDLPPEIDLTFEQDEETYFIITHNGGDDITDETTSKVSVIVNETERFAIVADDGTGELDYPYEAGDEVGVSTSSPYDYISVVWHSEDGSEDAILGET